MAITRVWVIGWALFLVFGRLSCADRIRAASSFICYAPSLTDSIYPIPDSVCPFNGISSFDVAAVIEGNELLLQRALSMVHRNTHDYIAVLFYASWCPFSHSFKPTFSFLASFYTSVPHIVIQESSIRPSILSKYGVHGLPALYLMNSTMRVRYYGSRSLHSLSNFYADITGIKTKPVNKYCKAKPVISPKQVIWTRPQKDVLQRDTYLTLATIFVVLRVIHLILPRAMSLVHYLWRNNSINLRIGRVWEHPLAYLNRAKQLLKEPCKSRNLQEGALNAKAWASKSLASVSIGESSASSSRVLPVT